VSSVGIGPKEVICLARRREGPSSLGENGVRGKGSGR